MSTEKQQVALLSLAASALLAAFKLAAGILTGSLGILSEALHSVIDAGATVVTYIAVRWGDQPPDDSHHYGHAKAESVAALIETGLLFVTTAWIAYEAIYRLATGSTEIEVTWWAAGILVVSILVDLNRSRVLKRVADKTSSEALEADALHFSSDMWNSAVVLVGLGAVWWGFPWADAIAALIVAAFVGLAGWKLGQRTVATLLDTAPEGVAEAVADIGEETEGVLAVRRSRIRRVGATLFIDTDISIRRTLPLDEVTAIKTRFTTALKQKFPDADISLTTHPVALDDETVYDKVMLHARRRGLAVHHLTVQQVGDRLSVSFDIEVDGGMPLTEAHEIASSLERALRQELGSEVEVESHIEPLQVSGIQGTDAAPAEKTAIEALLRKAAGGEPMISDVHNVRVRESDGGLFVTYHCRLDGVQTVEAVHEAVDRLEDRLKKASPAVRRVIAHAEPLRRALH